jgi:hypothetical protein
MTKLYGIIDTARDEKLYPLVKSCPAHICLFAGDLEEPVEQAAPYLVRLTKDTPLKDIWRNEGWGQAWGILVRSDLELMALRKHLRKFLLAQLPDGNTVFFRFYDPRVWRTYWPTCTEEEKSVWLEGIDSIVAEEVESQPVHQ